MVEYAIVGETVAYQLWIHWGMVSDRVRYIKNGACVRSRTHGAMMVHP